MYAIRSYYGLEGRLRDYASSRIQRGKVELSVRIREKNANLQVTPDPEAARAYMGAVMEIADSLGYSGEVPVITSYSIHYTKLYEEGSTLVRVGTAIFGGRP